LAIIEELKDYSGRGKYLFPGARTATKPISDAALINALRNMGFTKDEMVAHGFRSAVDPDDMFIDLLANLGPSHQSS
jgi:hypothetical protein